MVGQFPVAHHGNEALIDCNGNLADDEVADWCARREQDSARWEQARTDLLQSRLSNASLSIKQCRTCQRCQVLRRCPANCAALPVRRFLRARCAPSNHTYLVADSGNSPPSRYYSEGESSNSPGNNAAISASIPS